MRAVTVSAVGLLLLAAGLTGCAQKTAPVCEGGDVRLLQGLPTDLPGGGRAGFTETDADADPPSVHLSVAGDSADDPPDVPTRLSPGDTFTVVGTIYEVTCISTSVVTLGER